MARKSPVELHRIALSLHGRGHAPSLIADMLGLHPGALRNWLSEQASRNDRTGTPVTGSSRSRA